MYRLLSLVLVSSLLAGSVSAAPCSNSPFKLLDDVVAYGDSFTTAKRNLERRFSSRGLVVEPRAGMLVATFERKPYKNLKQVIVLTQNGKVTRIMFSYADDFMRNFGGPTGTFNALFPKLNDKYGAPDETSYDDAEDKAKLIWREKSKKGDTLSTMLVIAGDRNGIDLRFDCDALENEIANSAAKSANFGF
jgi:hypothetical protein